jgi:hypothetical protein
MRNGWWVPSLAELAIVLMMLGVGATAVRYIDALESANAARDIADKARDEHTRVQDAEIGTIICTINPKSCSDGRLLLKAPP